MTSFAVTTRTLPTRLEGLATGIERLEELCPSAVVLEAATTQPLLDVAAAVQASGRPVLAVIGGLFGDADADPYAALDGKDAEGVISGLRATVPGCARLACDRLVVPISTVPCPDVSKEQLADRLCRRLHGLAAGERVVTSGQLKLRNGSRVIIDNSVVVSDSARPIPKEN